MERCLNCLSVTMAKAALATSLMQDTAKTHGLFHLSEHVLPFLEQKLAKSKSSVNCFSHRRMPRLWNMCSCFAFRPRRETWARCPQGEGRPGDQSGNAVDDSWHVFRSLTAMNDIVTKSSHAQCELCKILKTARMMEQCANNMGNHGLLLGMLSFREGLSKLGLLWHFSNLLTTVQHRKTSESTSNHDVRCVAMRARFVTNIRG